MTPLLIVCGPAGSGKDTVAEYLGRYLKIATIAQADPMKRFARDVFGFSELALWGPSEERNKPDERYADPHLQEGYSSWDRAVSRVHTIGEKLVERVLPQASVVERGTAHGRLVRWCEGIRDAHVKTGSTLTPRYMLQTVGTEWGRKVAPSMWNDLAIRDGFSLLGGGCYYTRTDGLVRFGEERAQPHQTLRAETPGPELAVITDGRFRNEVLGVKRAGGVALLVVNPAGVADVEGGVKGHRSEAELGGVPRHWFDYVLTNDKTQGLLALENKVAALARFLTTTGQVSI